MRDIVVKVIKLGRILRLPTWRRAFIQHRVAAAAEHAFVLKTMPDIKMVIDVGANRGQFSLVAREFFPHANIIAFEPLSGPAATWRRLFDDDARAQLVEAAIGTASGEAVIHVAARDDSSSLLHITSIQNTIYPGTAEIGTKMIRVTRLADGLPPTAIERPALLKLDVQGFELEALCGCEELLDRFNWIYVECSFIELYAGQALADEVIAWLRLRGFTLIGLYNLTYDEGGRAVQGDFLFYRSGCSAGSSADDAV